MPPAAALRRYQLTAKLAEVPVTTICMWRPPRSKPRLVPGEASWLALLVKTREELRRKADLTSAAKTLDEWMNIREGRFEELVEGSEITLMGCTGHEN